jgi:hypothetical protein
MAAALLQHNVASSTPVASTQAGGGGADAAAAAAAAGAANDARTLAGCYTCYCYGLSINLTRNGQAGSAEEALTVKAQCSPFIASYTIAEIIRRCTLIQ